MYLCKCVCIRVYFPLAASGGPWTVPKNVTQEQFDLVRKVPNCEKLQEPDSLTSDKGTALARHLANVPSEQQEVDGVHAVVVRTSKKAALLEA